MLIIDHGNHSPLYYAHHSLTSWCQWHFPSWLQISAVNIHFCTKGTRRGVRFALSGFRDACIGPMTDLGVLFCLQWHHWWFLLLALSELSNVFQTPVLQEIGPSSLLEIGVLATLCNPMDRSPPGSSVHGIFQASVLEWFAVSFFRESSWPRDRTWVSCTKADSLPTELPGKPKRWEAYIKTGLRRRRGFGNWGPFFLPILGPLHPGTWWKQVDWLTEILRYLIAGSEAGMFVERTVIEVLSLLWRLCPYSVEVDFWTVLWEFLYP